VNGAVGRAVNGLCPLGCGWSGEWSAAVSAAPSVSVLSRSCLGHVPLEPPRGGRLREIAPAASAVTMAVTLAVTLAVAWSVVDVEWGGPAGARARGQRTLGMGSGRWGLGGVRCALCIVPRASCIAHCAWCLCHVPCACACACAMSMCMRQRMRPCVRDMGRGDCGRLRASVEVAAGVCARHRSFIAAHRRQSGSSFVFRENGATVPAHVPAGSCAFWCVPGPTDGPAAAGGRESYVSEGGVPRKASRQVPWIVARGYE